MKEHPILFNAENVKAILDGKKTQTRRVITPQPSHVYLSYSGRYHFDGVMAKHPYLVGDRLWVKETVYQSILGDWYYRADDKPMREGDFDKDEYYDGDDMSPRPSMFLHRWASRITLEITGVRVERVQEITPHDCLAEGITNAGHIEMMKMTITGLKHHGWASDRIIRFAKLWDSLNAKRGYGWEVNPFVWCISFKKLD